MERARKELSEAIQIIELKLNKTFLLITEEIDQLRDPLQDAIQDFDK